MLRSFYDVWGSCLYNAPLLKNQKVLVIIPAYNESGNIEKVVDNLIQNYPQYDYIVVNDGSKDDTSKICITRGYNYYRFAY
jgi:glycosyltransferase involved in cell wall biosynthesis